MLELSISTPMREVLMDITSEVEDAVGQAADPSFTGIVHIYVPHTTAGVTVNEGADPSVVRDIVEAFAHLVPRNAGYRHQEGNADAHIKTCLVGCHQAVPVENGRLKLGTWQSIYLAEFDGPRRRRVWLELTASALDR